jgi:hypothetical protein
MTGGGGGPGAPGAAAGDGSGGGLPPPGAHADGEKVNATVGELLWMCCVQLECMRAA